MQVNVNGKSFNVPNGANVSIINNVLYVDGQEYTGDDDTNANSKSSWRSKSNRLALQPVRVPTQ